MSSYETVIGLEVHAQLRSQTKLFCACPTDFGAPPNTNVCPVCLGLPGALPVPNQRAIEMAAQAGLALACTVAPFSRFARKNYFYPDLPKGYQISQFDLPLNARGKLEIEVAGKTKTIGIQRIHVEEDAAKNIHGAAAVDGTLVDYNRGGTPLIEIVSEPDLRSSEEAEVYLKKLREILMAIGVNDGNLEEGSFRCDANVSIRPFGREKLGTRAELKNINSFRFVRKAIDYEIARQESVLTGGGSVVQETRTWNDALGKTISMRSKEEAHDYRYFPDPDLPPLVLKKEKIEELRAALPELPEAKRARWQRDWGVTAYDAGVLSSHPEVARYFEQVAQELARRWGDKLRAQAGKKAANFIQSEVLRVVQTNGLEARFPVHWVALAELLDLVEQATINGKIAKQVFTEMLSSGKAPSAIVAEQGLAQVADPRAIENEVDKVLAGNSDKVAQYRAGKVTLLGFFVGQIMKATGGSANPQLVNDTLKRKLESK